MRTSPGACRRQARLAAVLGSPIPTKQTAPSSRTRAAATIIISSGVQPSTETVSLRSSGAEDIGLHPGEERVTVTADRIPGDVEVVVPHRVGVRVGGLGPARDVGDVVDHPGRQDDRARARLELVNELLHRDESTPRCEDRFLLDAGDAPELDVPGPIRLL